MSAHQVAVIWLGKREHIELWAFSDPAEIHFDVHTERSRVSVMLPRVAVQELAKALNGIVEAMEVRP